MSRNEPDRLFVQVCFPRTVQCSFAKLLKIYGLICTNSKTIYYSVLCIKSISLSPYRRYQNYFIFDGVHLLVKQVEHSELFASQLGTHSDSCSSKSWSIGHLIRNR